LERNFNAGDVISPKTLYEKGLITRCGGRLPRVKILNAGAIKKTLTVINCETSQTAREAVEKAGGTVR